MKEFIFDLFYKKDFEVQGIYNIMRLAGLIDCLEGENKYDTKNKTDKEVNWNDFVCLNLYFFSSIKR